jgi:23S rRNA A2030 N6-methylase RlmJ
MALEWRMHAPRTDHRLAGSGLNPPGWRIEAALETAGAWLRRHWGDASGGLRVEPLV